MAPAISVRSACLAQLEQKSCWACASGVPLALEVSTSDARATRITLNSSHDDDRPRYGARPPEMQGTVPVQLVVDTDQPARGPAYLFQQPINKTVVLHEQALNGSGGRGSDGGKPHAKRSWDELERLAALHPRANTFAQPGERPWFCHWNNTMLQGFIYVNVSASEGDDWSLASSVATAVPTSGPVSASDYSSSVGLPTTTATTPAAAAAPSATPHARRGVAHDRAADGDAHAMPSATTTTATGRPTVSASAHGSWPSDLPPAYPKAIKLEERRLPGVSATPYCVQMQILDDLSLGPLPDDGRVVLEETESARQHRMVYGQRHRKYRRDKRSVNDDNYCACVWLGQ